MTTEQKLTFFRAFLEEKADFFHSCSVSRWKSFMELFETFAQVETTEDRMDAYGEIHTVKVNPNNITELADGLRLMRLPDPDDLDDLEGKRLDAAGQRRMEKMLDDDRLGDKNPIRKDITKYIAGEKDVPRDILIKTYILVHDAQQASRYDLDSLLVSAGYPPIYVRAASGLDALACYLLFDPEGNTDAYAEYKDEILRLRRDLARQLGRTDRLQEAAEEKAEKKHNRMLERLGQLIHRR